MKILSKSQAQNIVNLKVYRKIRFDRGKYKTSVIGAELPLEHAIRMKSENNIVWGERRKDKDGPYLALFCIDSCK